MSRSDRDVPAGKNSMVVNAEFLRVGSLSRKAPSFNTLKAQTIYALPLPFTLILAERSLAKKMVFTKVIGQGPNVATNVFKGVLRAF